MSINHINGNGMPQMPGGAQITEMTPGADELGQKIVEAAQALVEVLGGENVHVSQSNGVGKAHGHKGPELSAPELDEADLEKAGKADLEAVVAFLQMKMDEKMAKVQGERLESLKGQLESAQKTQMEKINKSIEEARKQEAAAKAQKALGWLSAVIAVITAVVVTVCTGGLAAGFAIAGADKQWHWAEAVIDGTDVVVSAKEVAAPVAVRYAFRANPMGDCNLYNKEGLPASPFRTDSW